MNLKKLLTLKFTLILRWPHLQLRTAHERIRHPDASQRFDHQEPNRQSRHGREHGGRRSGAFRSTDASLSSMGRRWGRPDHHRQRDGRRPRDDRAGGVVLQDDQQLHKFKRWARVGRSGGAQFWLQINHPGRQMQANLGQKPGHLQQCRWSLARCPSILSRRMQ